MCLIVKSKRLYKTNKSIIAYKLVSRDEASGCYYTPYQHCFIPDEVIHGEKNFVAGGIIHFSSVKDEIGFHWCKEEAAGSYFLNGGMVHCYLTLEDAIRDTVGWGTFFRSYIVYKVEIPAGVEYVRGKLAYSSKGDSDMDRVESISAKEIKFIGEEYNTLFPKK
jgi:hypothetical protein